MWPGGKFLYSTRSSLDISLFHSPSLSFFSTYLYLLPSYITDVCLLSPSSDRGDGAEIKDGVRLPDLQRLGPESGALRRPGLPHPGLAGAADGGDPPRPAPAAGALVGRGVRKRGTSVFFKKVSRSFLCHRWMRERKE